MLPVSTCVVVRQRLWGNGLMIKSPEEIAPVMKRAREASGPVIIGVYVDYRDNRMLFENVDTRAIH